MIATQTRLRQDRVVVHIQMGHIKKSEHVIFIDSGTSERLYLKIFFKVRLSEYSNKSILPLDHHLMSVIAGNQALPPGKSPVETLIVVKLC